MFKSKKNSDEKEQGKITNPDTTQQEKIEFNYNAHDIEELSKDFIEKSIQLKKLQTKKDEKMTELKGKISPIVSDLKDLVEKIMTRCFTEWTMCDVLFDWEGDKKNFHDQKTGKLLLTTKIPLWEQKEMYTDSEMGKPDPDTTQENPLDEDKKDDNPSSNRDVDIVSGGSTPDPETEQAADPKE